MDEERAVLLGVVQERQGVDNASPYVCKAGGTPAWYGDAPAEAEALQCSKCSNHLFLVAQVYAPVDSDRTLYVFGCNSVSCTEAPGSWRVLRDQASPIEATNSSAIEGVTPVTTAPDNSRLAWGAEGDDSDWSDEEDDTAAAVASTEGTGTDLTDLELLLQQRDDAMKMPTAVTASKKKIDTTSKTSASTAQLVNAFPAMPIDVMDEPFEDYTSENDFSHENKLLEEYIRQEEEEKSEDVDKLRKVLDSTKKKRAGGGGGNTSVAGGSGESYEKTPAHQRHFMRFQKRINRCPLQCLRYDYGGEPLWPVPAPTSLVVPRCACGEERVFELQLTPTINYFLKVDAFAATPTVAPSEGGKPAAGPPSGGMDWLSILVYSCPSSCKKSRSEFIIVLPAAAT